MKKLIILSDGTGNGAAKRHGTNIRRLYEALDLHQRDQIAFYDDGVGSKDFLPLKLLGGVFGWGLKRNVLEMYKFLCQGYREAAKDDDQDRQIYLFGFSRGAFTVRILAGLIDRQGLYTNYTSQQDLDAVAAANYHAYRLRHHHPVYNLIVKLRGSLNKAKTDLHPEIEFIGVWDTVDAYGLPIDELAILWDRFIYPIRFPDRQLSRRVKRGCHALSVDEERLTFQPLLWNEENEQGRIEQVWFPGVHSDVGGGYPESELALLSLDWMISKVEDKPVQNGLKFIPETRKRIAAHSDWHGMQHDSRSGVGAYYRYKPRDIEKMCHDPDPEGRVVIERAKIHRSVFERIKAGFNGYSPTGLPRIYEVVRTPSEDLSAKHELPGYEAESERAKRDAAMRPALDIIFLRRWLYYALLAATLLLLASRFFLHYDADGICDGSACLIDPLLVAVQALLPDMFEGWFDALRQNSQWLWGFLVVFLLLFQLKAKLLDATRSRAEAAWSMLVRNQPVQSARPTVLTGFREAIEGISQAKLIKRLRSALYFLGFLAIIGLILVLIDRSIMHVRGVLGGVCRGGAASGLSVRQGKSIGFEISNPCAATGIRLEKGGRYRIQVQGGDWHDGGLKASPDQVESTPFQLTLFLPFRRHLGEPWMRLMGRIGPDGNDSFAIGKGLDELQAKSTGELFLYANDAVFGLLPGDKWSLPYTWEPGRNQGTAQITVTRLD